MKHFSVSSSSRGSPSGYACLGDRVFQETCLRAGKCAGLRVGRSNRNLEHQVLQTGSLHPRSQCGQYAAFPDVRISLMIWSSANLPQKGVHLWAGTLALSISSECMWILPGVPTRRRMRSSVHVWFHRIEAIHDSSSDSRRSL